jgi:Glycosyl transferase family 2
MMVKDEADIIEHTLKMLAGHVDEVLVHDNQSTDGTRDIVADFGPPVRWQHDKEVGYWQSRKMTGLAMDALDRGHQWVLPVDADEFWYVAGDPPRRIADFLSGLSPDVHIVRADLYNHLPTVRDMPGKNPFQTIGYRKIEHQGLPKVACRLHPSLTIHAGNHSASLVGAQLERGGLAIRHYSWRNPRQYVRKIRNGIVAYSATTLPKEVGIHWRMWTDAYGGYSPEQVADHSIALPPDDAVEEHFFRWFYSEHPNDDKTLVYDPAPSR